MRTVYLTRHCKYEGQEHLIPGRLPVSLSAEGIIQAQKLQEYFTDKNIEKIYSSPVKRAVETSEIIASGVLTVVTDLRLAETFTAYQGMQYEGEVDWHDLYGHVETLGGETIQDQQERMVDFWENGIKNSEDDLIILSHGHLIWALYCYLFKKDLNIDELNDTGHTQDPEYLKMSEILKLFIDGDNLSVEKIVL